MLFRMLLQQVRGNDRLTRALAKRERIVSEEGVGVLCGGREKVGVREPFFRQDLLLQDAVLAEAAGSGPSRHEEQRVTENSWAC